MQTKAAIDSLKALKDEAEREGSALEAGDKFASWNGRVESVLTKSLGVDHHLTKAFTDVRYTLGVFGGGTPDSAFREAFITGLREATGIIEAASTLILQARATMR